jgi:hypothetical protein
MKPVSALKPAPTRKAIEEQEDDEQADEDPQRLELTAQVRARALLDRLRDLDHLGRPLGMAEHRAHQDVRDGEREERHPEDHPERVVLERAEGRLDTAAFLGQHDVHLASRSG